MTEKTQVTNVDHDQATWDASIAAALAETDDGATPAPATPADPKPADPAPASPAPDPAAPTDPAPAVETPVEAAPVETAITPPEDEKSKRIRERNERLRAEARKYTELNEQRELIRLERARAERAEMERQAVIERANRAEQEAQLVRDLRSPSPEIRARARRALNINPKEIGEDIVAENTPEAIIASARYEAEMAARKVNEEAERLRQAREAELSRNHAVRTFVNMALTSTSEDGTPKYPALTLLYTPEQLAAAAIQRAQHPAAGEDSDIADWLEQQAQPRYKKAIEKVSAPSKVQSPSTQKAGTATPAGTPVATSTATARAPQVSNTATGRATLPANYEELTPAEQARADQALYNALAKR